jgi:hypothetical protein
MALTPVTGRRGSALAKMVIVYSDLGSRSGGNE